MLVFLQNPLTKKNNQKLRYSKKCKKNKKNKNKKQTNSNEIDDMGLLYNINIMHKIDWILSDLDLQDDRSARDDMASHPGLG